MKANENSRIALFTGTFDPFTTGHASVVRRALPLFDHLVIAVPVAHSIIAIQSTLKGLRKLILNKEKIAQDLDNMWPVVAEAIQTILRREAYPHPYEALKQLTRGNEKVTEQTIHDFIATLNVSDEVRKELLAITPHNYTGI